MTDDGLVIILLWQIFGAFNSSSTDNVTRKWEPFSYVYFKYDDNLIWSMQIYILVLYC